MQFSFTDDQVMFAETVRDILANECPPSAVRASWEDPDGRVPGLWETLAATGVLGVAAPEAHGGLDMSTLDLVLPLEEFGYAACPEPVAEHAAVAIPLLSGHAAGPVADEWLGRAAEGTALLTAGSPTDAFVLAAERADLALLCADDEVHAVPAGSYTAVAQASVDHARRLARVDWTRGPDTLLSDDHKAAWSCAQGEGPEGGDPSLDVSTAKVLASDAVDLACRAALQCHGAIGYTIEHDLQLWLKRGWALSASWGDAAFHRRRVGEALAAG